ncbi:YebC-like protein [Jackrogersella minutella]|nr:YebC-like protein [Jackrogersella minutella]
MSTTCLSFFPSRSFAPRLTVPTSICAGCRRPFTSNSVLRSGHNRWSKIQHKKGATDNKKQDQRSMFADSLVVSSRLFGPDPRSNSQLATLIALCKKGGMPKANIDAAIARGQGKSSTGKPLEKLTFEVMMPSSVAVVIELETDNTLGTFQILRRLIRKNGGVNTPVAFLFTKVGRAILKGNDDDDFDELMMQALDAGAEDVEKDEDGNMVVLTQPNAIHQVTQNLSKTLSRETLSSEIMWLPVADRVKLDDPEAATAISTLLTTLRENPDVQAIYANVERGAVSEEVWSAIDNNLDT